MIKKKRSRAVWSLKNELLIKSREAMLAAVQIFNNPSSYFKSEIFIVLTVIAWTYIMHAFYRQEKIDYRYFKQKNKRKSFNKIKNGRYKYWELEACLNHPKCPLDHNVKNNLKFLMGLRHEIEHQMTHRIDEYLSAKFQACCINYNDTIKNIFGSNYGIDKDLSFSLQFVSLSEENISMIQDSNLPKHIQNYVLEFDNRLSQEEFNNQKYAYRVIFIPKTVNHKEQADKVITFIKAGSELANQVNQNQTYAVIKETEKNKYLPSDIIKIMQEEGFKKFNMHYHTKLWKSENAKASEKYFGVQIGKTWYWYDAWLKEIRQHCIKHKENYK